MSDGIFWLTTTLEFPKDRDRWVKQEPIPGNHQKWVYRNCHVLTDMQKRNLALNKEVSWQDHNGVWVKIQILDHKVPTKWGTHKPLIK
jgi:hypothetical protein